MSLLRWIACGMMSNYQELVPAAPGRNLDRYPGKTGAYRCDQYLESLPRNNLAVGRRLDDNLILLPPQLILHGLAHAGADLLRLLPAQHP